MKHCLIFNTFNSISCRKRIPQKHDHYKMLIEITDILILFSHKRVFCVCFEPISFLAMYIVDSQAAHAPPPHKPPHANKGVGLRERVRATKLLSMVAERGIPALLAGTFLHLFLETEKSLFNNFFDSGC